MKLKYLVLFLLLLSFTGISCSGIINNDIQTPYVVFTSPTYNATILQRNIIIQGTAGIDSPFNITKVEVKMNDGTYQPATGTTNWFINLTIPNQQNNRFYARVTSDNGRINTSSELKINYNDYCEPGRYFFSTNSIYTSMIDVNDLYYDAANNWIYLSTSSSIIKTRPNGTDWQEFTFASHWGTNTAGIKAMTYDTSSEYFYLCASTKIIRCKFDGTWEEYAPAGKAEFYGLSGIDYDSSSGYIFVSATSSVFFSNGYPIYKGYVIRTKFNGSGYAIIKSDERQGLSWRGLAYNPYGKPSGEGNSYLIDIHIGGYGTLRAVYRVDYLSGLSSIEGSYNPILHDTFGGVAVDNSHNSVYYTSKLFGSSYKLAKYNENNGSISYIFLDSNSDYKGNIFYSSDKNYVFALASENGAKYIHIVDASGM